MIKFLVARIIPRIMLQDFGNLDNLTIDKCHRKLDFACKVKQRVYYIFDGMGV